MARLIYASIASLDGYVADEDGNWDWSAPDEEVHTAVNRLEETFGTHLYGRRMYEVLVAWEHPEEFEDQGPAIRDYAEIWQSADKVVYSRTLEEVSSARTRIERDFDPEAVCQMKAEEEADIAIGGPELARQAFQAGLIDECHLFLAPVTVGTGKPSLPAGLKLELLDARRFRGGVVYLRYRVET
jgi:dihydrofolate reductase